MKIKFKRHFILNLQWFILLQSLGQFFNNMHFHKIYTFDNPEVLLATTKQYI